MSLTSPATFFRIWLALSFLLAITIGVNAYSLFGSLAIMLVILDILVWVQDLKREIVVETSELNKQNLKELVAELRSAAPPAPEPNTPPPAPDSETPAAPQPDTPPQPEAPE